MTDPWEAERVVDPAMAKTLIESQFKDLQVKQLALFGEGWDNLVYLASVVCSGESASVEDYLFHFPRRELAAGLLTGETATLRWLAGQADSSPLKIPIPRFVGKPTEKFDWPFVGYDLIAGTTWCRADMSLPSRRAAAVTLAEFLHWLHHQPLTDELCEAAPTDRIGRLDLSRRIPQAEEYLARARSLELAPTPERFHSYLAEVAPHLRTPTQQTLVHGDLYSRHLVVDSNQKLEGIIDWGDVHRGDPASDLAIPHLVLPVDAHEAFREAYGPIDSDTWELARCAAVRHALITVVYGHDTKDEALVRESRFALESIAAHL